MGRFQALQITPNFGVSDGKESAWHEEDLSSIPGLGRFPGGGNGKTLQYSCLENSMDRGAWQVTVPGITKSQTRLGDWQFVVKEGKIEDEEEEKVLRNSIF